MSDAAFPGVEQDWSPPPSPPGLTLASFARGWLVAKAAAKPGGRQQPTQPPPHPHEQRRQDWQPTPVWLEQWDWNWQSEKETKKKKPTSTTNPKRACRFYAAGLCSKSHEACDFVHNPTCWNYREYGECPAGDNCLFPHRDAKGACVKRAVPFPQKGDKPPPAKTNDGTAQAPPQQPAQRLTATKTTLPTTNGAASGEAPEPTDTATAQRRVPPDRG